MEADLNPSELSAPSHTHAAAEDLDTFSLIEPPPLDWKSDSSGETGPPGDPDRPELRPPAEPQREETVSETALPAGHENGHVSADQDGSSLTMEGPAREEDKAGTEEDLEDEELEDEGLEDAEAGDEEGLDELTEDRPGDDDHTRIQALLSQLQMMGEEPAGGPTTSDLSHPAEPEASAHSLPTDTGSETTALLFSERHQRDVLGLLQCTHIGTVSPRPSARSGQMDAVVSVSYSEDDARRYWRDDGNGHQSFSCPPDEDDPRLGAEPPGAGEDSEQGSADSSLFKDVPGPCDPEDLLEGVIFGAKYLGSTQIKSDRNPSTNARMAQAQEAVDRIKAPDDETQPMTEVDLFISTQRIKVLSADTQEAMMDHPLQMISYIADIDQVVVLMVRRKPKGQEGVGPGHSSSFSSPSSGPQKKCLMICHVFCSEDAQVIAQAIGQAFGVAYQSFLQASGIKAGQLRPGEYGDYLGGQELYNGDLAHFSDSQNIRDVTVTKAAGDILGLAVVESGWGSILPTVVVANLLHGGPAERCGELSIGDRIMSVNGTSLVGLPIATCQNIIRDLKNQKCVKLSIVHCPPVTMAIIRRPDPKFQLGFSVEDGIICSLMRGGIAERGGIRVGHRIIEINGQSVVATPHDKIIQILTNAVGEIHLKTMPASTYRLLTGQEQPLFL